MGDVGYNPFEKADYLQAKYNARELSGGDVKTILPTALRLFELGFSLDEANFEKAYNLFEVYKDVMGDKISTKDIKEIKTKIESIIYTPDNINRGHVEKGLGSGGKIFSLLDGVVPRSNKDGKLEDIAWGKVAAIVSGLSFIGAIVFLSSGVTGGAVANLSIPNTSFVGVVLFIVGLVAGFFWLKKK